VFAKGKYLWVDLSQVETLLINPPRFPRDLLYIPARLETPTVAGEVFLPALYPLSFRHADDQVKLGRLTDWLSAEGGPTLGAGQHTFLADDDPVGILEWRELQIAHAPEAPTDG